MCNLDKIMNGNEKKHVIWESSGFLSEEVINDLIEGVKENCEANNEDVPDDRNELEQMAFNLNDEYLDDERVNLDIQLEQPIIAIADVGRWNGRFQGYTVFKSGNIKDIFSTECDDASWYSNGKDVYAEMRHHDGTNYVIYRVAKPGVDIDKFLSKVYFYEEITPKMLNYYTKSIHPDIAKIYGW